MDIDILLDKVEVYAYHGWYKEEQKVGGKYQVSIHAKSTYLGSDDLNNTLNYEKLYEIIIEEMKIPSNLLEEVLERMVKRVKPNVSHGTITIAKVNPPFKQPTRKVELSHSW